MAQSTRIAVIGGGIIGLSSAVRIIETTPGVKVTVIAEKLTPETTGDGSAGFWYPYLLGEVSAAEIRFWCENTFNFLKDIYKSSEASDHGIGLLSAFFLHDEPLEKPTYSDIYFQWRALNDKELALFPSHYKYGVFVTTLYAECCKLLPMLMKRLQSKGGQIVKRKLKSIEELSDKFDIVINCPGVGAAKLVPDPSVVPIRGQVIRVRAPWIKHAVMAGDDFYILPNSEEVICGGTHQEGNWSTKVDPSDRDKIWQGCTEIIPSLKKAKIVREWVGLRPGRPKPRLERETMKTKNGILEVIHNYGHGGSGVTLFWGCAIRTTELLQDVLAERRKNVRANL
ncbi:D-amino-acid oxidase-like [Uloborus diversus]|uniref:D-amino-acid oxidase-like n=1 Tax=Uloborus diversus TaxID=327109 RepID=UPI00240A1D4B|nr:D-amino-acid oxidase-like [Uloborus diversus]